MFKKYLAVLLTLSLVIGNTLSISGNGLNYNLETEIQQNTNKEKYYQLLSSTNNKTELRQKFVELFGIGYTENYIRNNYTEIFGIEANEMDEAVLDMLTEEEHANQLNMRRGRTLNLFDPKFPEPEPELKEVELPTIDNENTINELEEVPQEVVYHENTSGSALDITNIDVVSKNARSTDVNISVRSITSTSVSLNVYIDSKHHTANNYLKMYDRTIVNPPYSGNWVTLSKGLSSQTYTKSGLKPGGVYKFRVQTYDFGTSSWKMKDITVQLPGAKTVGISNITKTKNSITFHATFPSESDYSNTLKFYDSTTKKWDFVPGTGQHMRSGTYTINNLNPGTYYRLKIYSYNDKTSSASYRYYDVTTKGNDQSITLVSKTATSVTVSAKFPGSGAHNNALFIQDKGSNNPVNSWFLVEGYYATDGNYTINNLTPNTEYEIFIRYIDDNKVWQKKSINITTNYKPQDLRTKNGQYVIFKLEPEQIARFGSGMYDRLVSNSDKVYKSLHELVGGDLPNNGNKMVIESTPTKNMPWWAQGLAGYPISWNASYIQGEIIRMNHYNSGVSDTVIHELGHNFDSYRWTFDAEVLTLIKEYYVLQDNNFNVPEKWGKVYTPTQFKDQYWKSDVEKVTGTKNYDYSLANNVYSEFMLTYRLAEIADTIGWQPFKDTFKYFRELDVALVPNTKLGKLNLFLTKLSDYSGRDVFSMITSKEMLIYEKEFGGKIERIQFQTKTEEWHLMEINHKTIYIKIPEPGDTDLEARVFDEENSYGETYKFRNGSWIKENYYAQIPGDINVGFNSTRFIQNINIVDIQKMAEVITSKIFEEFGYDTSFMTAEDLAYINFGIYMGINDSVYPNYEKSNPNTYLLNKDNIRILLYLIYDINTNDLDKDYYYINAKTQAEYAIYIASEVAAAGSYAAAVALLVHSGQSISTAGVTFVGSGGTGVGLSLVITSEAATALAASGVCAIGGVALQAVSDSAGNIYRSDYNKLQETTSESWSKGSYSSPEESLYEHYDKHGAEVGAKNKEDYLRKAAAFRDTILKKRLKPSHMVSGKTPNVFRYRFNNKYIDLEHVSEGVYRIISFGK